MDLCFVPGDANKLLTLSGSSDVRLWDLQRADRVHSVLFNGHGKAVRCASFWPDQPSECTLAGAHKELTMS